MGRAAFTLVELLVVVTIVAVLLALLAPALDRAVYEAELAVCAANFHGLGTALVLYAADNGRRYPHRPPVHERSNVWTWRPNALKGDGRAITNPWDERPDFKRWLDLDLLVCPLSGNIDLDAPQTYDANDAVFADYPLWFGWRYWPNGPGPLKGMFRMGDAFEWNREKYRFLATSKDERDTSNPYTETSHPDKGSRLAPQTLTDQQSSGSGFALTAGTAFTLSRWFLSGTYERSSMDMHFLRDDVSVQRARDLTYDDERLSTIPLYAPANSELPRGLNVLAR